VDQLLTFLGVAAVVIVTPGPDTALTVRNVVWGGRRHGLATAAGVVCGQLIWAASAVAGLAAVVRASEAAFAGLRIAGAVYLGYLGLLALRDAVRGTKAVDDAAAMEAGRTPGRALRQGLFSNLANPKMGVFFLSLLPQFAGVAHPAPVHLLALASIFAALTFCWLAGYCWVVDRAGDVLRRRRPQRVMDAVTGTALLGLGWRLATERRT
jgi:threonine/homoserine/homoserine lactone efflux protein